MALMDDHHVWQIVGFHEEKMGVTACVIFFARGLLLLAFVAHWLVHTRLQPRF